MGNFYDNGLNFECQRCSYCCGNGPGFVYLSKADLKKLCLFFKMGAMEFAEKYCRWADYYEGKKVLALLETKKYDCILWNNGCTAYEGRPIQCRTWPFWDWMVNDKSCWAACARTCPGMNRGPLHSMEEIQKASDKYKNNIPICFDDWKEISSAIDKDFE